jgi:ribokinase
MTGANGPTYQFQPGTGPGIERDIDVLVVGDLNPDLILTGDVIPRFGQSEQLLEHADLTLGGSAAIVAHGLARLGLRTTMVAVIGADTFGSIVREQLAGAGVDVEQLRTDPDRPTGLSVILNHADTRTILTLVGAIDSLRAPDVSDELLRRARHVHVSSFYLQPALAAGLPDLFTRARAAGATTSLDTNIDPAGRWAGLDDVLPVTDVLLPNRTEVLGIAARLTQAEQEPAAAAARIAALGPLVVVKDGERGAIAVTPDGREVGEPGERVAAIDTTGAGDSFDAAFIAARLAGLALSQCLVVACRAGGLSTLAVGGTAGQGTAQQVGLAAGSALTA